MFKTNIHGLQVLSDPNGAPGKRHDGDFIGRDSMITGTKSGSQQVGEQCRKTTSE